ncbi:MAG: hypothetical protein V1823_00925 [Chloroflexota bacterium]
MSSDKIIELKEAIISDFDGTIIDIETIGNFDKNPLYRYDSRRLKKINQVIFGHINKNGLVILCAKGREAINELNSASKQMLDNLERPFYALNTNFESSVWFNQLNKEIVFDGELQEKPYESKKEARNILTIPDYDDPFCDNGLECSCAWECAQYDKAIAHNRSCLLKERDILLKRYLQLNKKCCAPFPFTFCR